MQRKKRLRLSNRQTDEEEAERNIVAQTKKIILSRWKRGTRRKGGGQGKEEEIKGTRTNGR